MRILVVEDEKELADALARCLRQQGYAVNIAYDGEEALEQAYLNGYDLIVLDLNLPKVDGVEVCRRIRESGSSVGILMLTARAGMDDVVRGLDQGADDYLVKRVHMIPEFLARVRALLRRDGDSREAALQIGDLVLDPGAMKACVKDVELPLTTKEFRVLEYLMRHAGRVISQDELLEHVWSEDSALFSQTLKSHINSLRRKLEAVGIEGLITTIKNSGYVIGYR
jgi:DNA-binding response OmpR family regulator